MPQSFWYVQQTGRTFGPYSDADLRKMVASGRLRPDDRVRRRGYSEWTPVGELNLKPNSGDAKRQGKPAKAASTQSVAEDKSAKPATQQRQAAPPAEPRLTFRQRLLPALVISNVICFGVLLAVGTYVAVSGNSGSEAEAADDVRQVKNDKPAAPQVSTFDRDIQPLLKKYCLDCHNDKKHKAGLSLEKFRDADDVFKARKTWELVIKMVNTHEMPPEDEEALPTADERLLLTDWARATLDNIDCDGPVNPGRVTIRRLNRVEYRNTIRDLVGIDYEPTEQFPADDVGYGYDNIGDVLSISPLLMEKYLAAAEDITERVFEGRLQQVISEAGVKYDGADLRAPNGGGPSNGEMRLHSNGEAYALHDVKQAGEYVIRFQAWGERGGGGWPRMALRVDNRTVREVEVDTTSRKPKTFEIKVKLDKGRRRIGAAFTNDFYDPRYRNRAERDRNLTVSHIHIAGPTDLPKRAPKGEVVNADVSPYDRLMVAFPGAPGKGELSPEEAAQQILKPFATRAFRRPVTPKELERLVALVGLVMDQGDPFDRGIQLAMQGVLASPHFLFRIEQDRQPDDPKHPEAGYTIGDFELATRLSYFIYSSMPDQELFDLAARGELRKNGNLEKQVRRMLADPRGQALVDNFGGQWLQTRNLATVEPDPKHFKWDEKLRAAMERETLMLFGSVMRDDASVLRFLDADYTFVNARLAQHYGMKDVQGLDGDDKFVRVSLKGTPRRGVLTHGSVLTITSDPNRTSPVKRGKWVLEQVLGTPPPPAPPNVPPLEEEEDGKPLKGTLRQRMIAHQVRPDCVSCHERMDPIGFAFEHFDAVGRFREKDNGDPIDSTGKLMDGRAFKDAGELISLFVKSDKGLYVRNLSEQMLTYALGRGLEYYDQCAVDKIVGQVAAGDNRFSALVLAIVNSDPFQKRTGKDVPHE